MNITKTQYLTYSIILLTGIILGWLFFGGSSTVQNEYDGYDHEQVTSDAGEEVWTCSMHPSVRQESPGSCPICGMDLIPSTSEVSEGEFSMVMTEASMQLADIQTTAAVLERPVKEIYLPGRVEIDERRVSYITTHFSGRIRDVKIDFTGAPIRKGEVMATVYSPELVSAQRELLQAVQVRDRNPELYEAAVRKFRLWEFSDEQVQAIIERGDVQTNMEILSPVDGFVMERHVVDEQHVMEGSVIYEVANLEQLWVTFDAYENDFPWISEGDQVTFQTIGSPGEQYQVTIDFIDPAFNPQKRTIRLRANVENGNQQLRPDMLVRGTLQAKMDDEKIVVPSSAVLWTGPRSLVYVKDTGAQTPRFEVREVELGARTGNHYIIESGLREGDEVVFNGNFRIDSEFQLADRFSMMNREPGTPPVPARQQGNAGASLENQPGTLTNSPRESFDDVPDDFREKFTEAIEIYLNGKDALIESDLAGAQSAYENFNSTLEEIGIHGLSGDGHMAWMDSYEALTGHASDIASAGDLDAARTFFRSLSDELIGTVKMFGVEGVVYHQYCPMAFDNEGGDWLSREEQIQNPYLPESMLMCGEVIEKLE